ncbi:MAG: hypothetical protein WKG06_21920 [Segetibacter sp.]
MNNDNKFPEQEAPAKNTDDAFVQVSENGAPVMPSDTGKKTDIEKEDNNTTLSKQ